MIRMEINLVGQEEWTKIIAGFEDLSLMQTWEYGEAKKLTGPWKVDRLLFWKQDRVVGAAQAMIRFVPLLKRGMVWINRAPLWRKPGGEEDPALLAMMLDELRRYWVDERKMYLRVAPALLGDEDSRKLVESVNFQPCNSSPGWASERLDLSCSTEDLRKGLKQKWRNCLNKSERLGVSHISGISSTLMDEHLEDYRKILAHKGFTTNVSPSFLKVLNDIIPSSVELVAFSGKKEKERLGSILVVVYGNISMYLVGAVNEVGKKNNAGYYLLWNAICEMKERDCKWFDVGGASPETSPPGILHFKRGLAGVPYQLLGDVEAYSPGIINNLIKRKINKAKA